MDGFVVDIPWIFRWILVHLFVVPRRRKTSAVLYGNIWTEEGSPLLVNSMKLLNKLRKKDRFARYELAMRYGEPSIESAIKVLMEDGPTHIDILPLYPQYALSSTESCLHLCRNVFKKLGYKGEVAYFREFFDHPSYLRVVVETINETLREHAIDFLLYSYHGLPEHQVAATGSKCCFDEKCCRQFKEHSPKCYRAQCYQTTKLCNQGLAWPDSKSATAFQSRLGKRPWLRPYTDEFVRDLPQQGVKNLGVVCPSFTADCLETIEEICFRIKDDFQRAGGDKVFLVPSLNDRDDWVDAISEITSDRNQNPVRFPLIEK